MSSIKLDYQPRKWQLEASTSLQRFSVILLHRRAGKTVFNVIQSIGTILNCKHHKPVGAYFGPTRTQTKRTAWQYYKDFLKPFSEKGLVSFNETDLVVKFSEDIGGGMIYLLSYENIDSNRGSYLDHVVLDEYQLAPQNLWGKVVRPMLIDRHGKAIFSGTTEGRGILYQVGKKAQERDGWCYFERNWDQTDVIAQEEKDIIMEEELYEDIQQEYYLNPDSAIKGAYFGRSISKMKASDRIREDITYDPAYPVVTGWDIGLDGIVVWYAQKIGEQIRLIDCDMHMGVYIEDAAQEVLTKPYVYAYHLLPHDANHRTATQKGLTARGRLEKLGLKCRVTKKDAKKDGAIHATRLFLDSALASAQLDEPVKYGKLELSPLSSLSLYRAQFDERSGIPRATPVHNEHSHTADALMTLVSGVNNKKYIFKSMNPLDIDWFNTENNKDTKLNNWNPLRRNR